jgi:GT2 family glycosyltransferase
VATKDRPDDVRKLLRSLCQQELKPIEVIIVDASREPVQPMLSEFPDLQLRYLRHRHPSASAQRNAGIRACDSAATLIGVIDDDTTLDPTAVANMSRFWSNAAPDILGASFNICNYPHRGSQFLKHSPLAEKLGLYSATLGRVSLSGWQTIITSVTKNQFVDWLPSTAVVWRRQVFGSRLFDEFFESYSYLEDLDFSYGVGRAGRLVVVADAGFSHFPSDSGRVSARQFGRLEVRNRLYFVKKHGLSIQRCYIGLAIRFAMSLSSAVASRNVSLLARAFGNLEALAQS